MWPFIINILIALATSILTVTFSFWRFRSERWWELKAKTYTAIIESLHYIKKGNDYFYGNYLKEESIKNTGDETSWREFIEQMDSKNELRKSSSILQKREYALEEIERIIDVSSFIIKKEASKKLNKLKNDLHEIDETPREDEHYEFAKKTINDCIVSIKKIAKSDLETIFDKLLDLYQNR